jgi:hypothetical protein
MKWTLIVSSALALGLTVVPAFLVFAGTITWETHATLMLAGAVLWFGTAPFWMRERRKR